MKWAEWLHDVMYVILRSALICTTLHGTEQVIHLRANKVTDIYSSGTKIDKLGNLIYCWCSLHTRIQAKR